MKTICIPDEGQQGYGRDINPHFPHTDYLSILRAYTPTASGASFTVETYHKNTALVKIDFCTPTVYRLRMYPMGDDTVYENSVFSFAPCGDVAVTQDDTFVTLSTPRVTLRVRKCPWEISVELDERELTREQIRDFDVDSMYKALPLGFTTDEAGKPNGAFETMYLYSDENFYGFGEKFTDFEKRGQKISVWQHDALSTNSDRSYKAMPYFMSSVGYSVLLNTYTRTHFDMGATSGVSYQMRTEDPYLDYYMFCNRNYKGLVGDYTALSGRSPMIPRWAFGFWMSKMSYMTRQEVEDVVKRAAEFGMSMDVVHIDGWLSFGGNGLLEFDTKRFPDPEGMVRWLGEHGVHLSLWMFPYIPQSNMFANRENSELGAAAKEPQISLFDQLAAKGYLVKNAQGGPCTFKPMETGTPMGAIDFTNPEAVALVQSCIAKLMEMGVGVMKTDFSEEIPENAVFYDGTTGLQSHNRYTYLYAKTIFEASQRVKEARGERALLWGRSGYAGSQNVPANWAGDSSSTRNNLSAILKGGLSMGLSGVSFWGYDIGGFYNTDYQGKVIRPQEDEYIRSMQMGLMAPLSRSHGQQTPREPWNYSETVQKAFLKMNKLRYRMLPYVYSIAWETHFTGIPMMRAMLLEFQSDRCARQVSTQYMLGSSLLVAPVFDQQIQEIYLPEGSWADLATGERVQGGRWIQVDAPLDTIPLYMRPDSVIPMLQTAPMHASQAELKDFDVLMNLTRDIAHIHYDDDGDFTLTAHLDGGKVEICSDMDIQTIQLYLEQTPAEVYFNDTLCRFTKVAAHIWKVDVK
ncbi:MAG: glycoside hydrolase family 31 protein [Eubacteriales bacterium]|nr:glycoside hydrolase family 31 protein [Eubacteriales bacterium]